MVDTASIHPGVFGAVTSRLFRAELLLLVVDLVLPGPVYPVFVGDFVGTELLSVIDNVGRNIRRWIPH